MNKSNRKNSTEDLQNIPGVGPRLAHALSEIGYEKISELRGADPEKMFEKLCVLRDKTIDRCLLYVFHCAVYYAETPQPEPELLKWWNWKNPRQSSRPSPDSGIRTQRNP